METINLYVKFAFTSLSPDAQPISLGIVSDDIFNIQLLSDRAFFKAAFGEESKATHSKSFYAEFSDFDINRCDDWVKENVIKKLVFWNDDRMSKYKKNKTWKHGFDMSYFPSHFPEHVNDNIDSGNNTAFGPSYGEEGLRQNLACWLEQFSDYQIQFVVDCGFMNWYHLLQLLAEWDNGMMRRIDSFDPDGSLFSSLIDDKDGFTQDKLNRRKANAKITGRTIECKYFKTGFPKLPANISPVPEDLNDLIAHRLKISIREAFNESREELAYYKVDLGENGEYLAKSVGMKVVEVKPNKNNSLWDAELIKETYNKLK